MGYPVDIQLLGPVQVSAGHTVLALRGPRAERLLAALAVSVPRVVSIDRLVDAVWPVSAPAARVLRSALGLWRDSALAGLDCPALDADRVGLDELRLATWEQAITIELALGQHDELVSELAGLTELHPARERLVQLFMQALYRAGRKVDALSAFHRVRQRLAAELGLDPGPELQGGRCAELASPRGLAAITSAQVSVRARYALRDTLPRAILVSSLSIPATSMSASGLSSR